MMLRNWHRRKLRFNLHIALHFAKNSPSNTRHSRNLKNNQNGMEYAYFMFEAILILVSVGPDPYMQMRFVDSTSLTW